MEQKNNSLVQSDLIEFKDWLTRYWEAARKNLDAFKAEENWGECLLYDAQLNEIRMFAVILNRIFDNTFTDDWLNKIFELDIEEEDDNADPST